MVIVKGGVVLPREYLSAECRVLNAEWRWQYAGNLQLLLRLIPPLYVMPDLIP